MNIQWQVSLYHGHLPTALLSEVLSELTEFEL